MKRIKKNKLNLALVCSFSSVFASASCFGNSSSTNSNVINSSISIINNDAPPVLDNNRLDKIPEKTENKVINSAPSGANSEVNVEPNKSQDSNNTNSKFLGPEVIDISNVQSISSAESKLPEIDKFYLENINKEFAEHKLSDDQIERMILNYGVSSNFYSLPKYTIDLQDVKLDSNGSKSVQLSLIDSTSKQKVIDSVQWYQRNWYASKEVLKAGEDISDAKLTLTSDGVIKGKSHNKNDFGKVQVWAHYKGYLYSTLVDVDSSDNTKSKNENEQARAKAKELAKKWEYLPTLEKITEAYKWVTKNVKYDYSQENLVDDQSAYSALIKLNTVCTGYAKAFMMLMEELNVPCRLVTGTADYGILTGRASRHAWNMVEVDGEWYHVDTTSDRAEHRTGNDGTFNFFMMNDDDFVSASIFERGYVKTGNRFRNLKIKNYVNSENDVIVALDRQLGGLNKLSNSVKLNVAPSSYKNVLNAFKTANLELNESRPTSIHRHPYVTYDEVTYYFKEHSKEINIKNVSASVEKHILNNKTLGQYTIKVKFDQTNENIDLKPGNFIVKNAYVKDAIKENDGYILVLDHLNKYGDIEIELEDIKKIGFKFDIRNKKINLNVTRHTKPSASVSAVGENRIKLSNVNSNMEYKVNIKEWKTIEFNNQIIEGIVPGKLFIRIKDSNSHFESDIQKFEIKKGRDIDKIVKKYGSNLLIGVDSTMEYKLKDAIEWIPITTTKLRLNPGEYLIRTAPKDNQLASESLKVIIS
ncbi:hypothetical protein MBOVa_0620 [Mycoplasmopsis bovis 8790]|nr:hypothetical protein MBOVa_0620 [Mycoplasmopsis bovis 8790]